MFVSCQSPCQTFFRYQIRENRAAKGPGRCRRGEMAARIRARNIRARRRSPPKEAIFSVIAIFWINVFVFDLTLQYVDY